ncbi:hypothetical protein HALLA_06060 [Halostagnicola larsenii XH-48]|uniref:DUF192 domain-containing protein n=1 Tax=Halostagnicola larsenii XH-48 TaxID=797299 RepID=W0JMS8_9EURY|nr:DUF192 domain-containing protein [Halostagnicola larsenii]AHF98474.1 hypothetical protein HALLA_06060 [Halostagnicola larsenii XH-48]
MDTDRASRLLLVVALALVVGFVLVQVGIVPTPWNADQATVTINDANGEPRATVDAEVADTWSERYTGLSDHESLEGDEGMLFVHDGEGERTYVMRDMDFDIDIIFIDGDGEVTEIREARAPEADENGNNLEYSGRAKWVLEVPSGYADEHGIDAGDDVSIEYA